MIDQSNQIAQAYTWLRAVFFFTFEGNRNEY